jgi:hypothetical protein
MTEETNEGVDYLRALKQSAKRNAATGVAPAREVVNAQGPSGAGPDARERYRGSEKRRSMLYKCEGSAEPREDRCDVWSWASFNDVCLHGRYVKAQATYPAGPFCT